MSMEISVHAVVTEQDDGTYKAYCPDLGIEATGKNSDEAVRSLKEMVINRVGAAGQVRLTPVKCLKIKVTVK